MSKSAVLINKTGLAGCSEKKTFSSKCTSYKYGLLTIAEIIFAV